MHYGFSFVDPKGTCWGGGGESNCILFLFEILILQHVPSICLRSVTHMAVIEMKRVSC